MSRFRAAAGVFALIIGAVDLARTEELVTPIVLETTFIDPATGRESEAVSGTPLLLKAAFRNALLDRPQSLQQPRGLLRPTDGVGGDCAETARALRATGALARGDIALDGQFLALLSKEGHISVVDPQISLATSNILRIIDLKEAPSDLVVNARGALHAILPKRDILARIDVASGVVAPVDGVSAPRAIAPTPDGVGVVTRDSAALLLRNDKVQRIALSFEAHDVRATQDNALLFEGAQTIALVNARGRVVATAPFETASKIAYSPLANAVLELDRTAPVAMLRYFDGAPAQKIALANRADMLTLTPDGRYAIAALRREGKASIIDLALGQMVQAIAFGVALEDLSFTEHSIAMILEGRRTAALIARDSIRKGQEPMVRRIPLGPQDGASGEADRGLVAHAPDSETLLIVSPSRDAVLFLADAGVHDSASLHSVNLKGDAPVRLLAVPRGLRETAPGEYEALVTFARGGPHRLLIFDDAKSPLLCRDIAVRPRTVDESQAQVSQEIGLNIEVLRRTAQGLEVDFTLESEGATAHALIAQGLLSPWRAEAPVTIADGRHHVVLRRAGPGPLVLYAIYGDGMKTSPKLVESAP